jgi:protocatechuate 3,4-dioxygenase beta subunit
MNKSFIIWFLSLGTLSLACAQKQQNEKPVGGQCEGCEAIYEYGSKKLHATDTLPDFLETGPKLKISGTIFKRDGKTPAKDVILYVYHTDQQGLYSTKGNETGWGKRHGYIRGWIKTNADGKYAFFTLRPAAYPGRKDPEHIHPVIKEPGLREYWIDEYLFEDDPLITLKERNSQGKRGGYGIVKPTTKDGIQVVNRDIILGLNIPDYD